MATVMSGHATDESGRGGRRGIPGKAVLGETHSARRVNTTRRSDPKVMSSPEIEIEPSRREI